MYEVNLSENDVNLLRWCLQVAADVLATQDEGPVSTEDALGFISQMELLDSSLVSQVKPQREALFGAPDKSSYENMRLFNLD